MKLVEILAKELGEWPDGATHAVQDGKRSFLRKVWVCNGDQANTEHDGCQWILGRGVFPCESIRATELATDHATAIVTREMWQAERERAVTGMGVSGESVGKKYMDRALITMRDRIREIDATIEAMTAERAELVSKLAGEGLALIAVAAEPVEDMSDWRNWRAGDLVECLGNSGGYSLGKTYAVKGFDYDRDVVHTETDDRGSKTNGWRHYMFKFHSRPTA